ncbi:MAG: DNRLRE domain-containing protein [Clostridia bacterium]|nr:DNRLRE domain-containing protein [Clostridia bacterium]
MGALIIRIPTKAVFIDSSMPNQNFGGFFALFIGRFPPSTLYRALMEFDLSSLPVGLVVTKAELFLDIIRNDYPGTSKVFGIYRLQQEFDEFTVTYNNQPTFAAAPYSTLTIGAEIDVYVKADMTGLVQDWYYGRFTNYGLTIKAVDESIYSLFAAYSKYISDEAFIPYLEITLDTPFQITGRQFTSASETGLITMDTYQYSQQYDVSQIMNYTYFVTNTGTNSCEVFSQVSPDALSWIDDTKVYSVAPGEMVGVIPKTFSRYTRLAYKSLLTGSSTTINITLQQQA